MGTNLNLSPGTDYVITLQGSQRWVQVARVVSVLPDVLVLQLDDGRKLTVPHSAISSARPVTSAAGARAASGSTPSPASNAADTRAASGTTSRPASNAADARAASGTSSRPASKARPATPASAESFYLDHIHEKGSDVSAAWLLDLRTRLLGETTVRGPSARLRGPIADTLDAVARQLLENDYERHESAFLRASEAIAAATAALDASASEGQRPPAYFRILLRQLAYAVETEHSRFLTSAASSPDFTAFAAREHFYVGEDQTFLLTVSAALPAGDAPVESVQLVLTPSPEVRPIGAPGFAQTLRPGETRELVQRLRASDLALGVGEVSISMHLRFRCASGEFAESPARTMTAVLEPARRFVAVTNPYSRYSGGTPVEEKEMFFGRQELLDRIYGEATVGPLGQCFVLYGQKRSGKSSVLRQLSKRLRAPNLAIYLSLGTVDTARAERSFVQACVDALYERLVLDFDLTDVLEHNWPRDSQIDAYPIESFRRSVRAARLLLHSRKGWKDVRPIFLIDEFTYVYEYIQEGLLSPAFMRQWKSLLESQIFSAVLVGQDTMPRFKEEYPNEFGVTHDERISYLSDEQARALAEEPIRMGSETRYKGASLDRLIGLTAGSPFYLQIFCDRLVQHLNRNRLMFITESVVSDVLAQLTAGPAALALDKFDPLITAAGESVAPLPRERYLALLTRVALSPAMTSQDVAADDAAAVRDLFAREVLERDQAGRLRIRVGLFAEWLRANSVGIAG